MRYIIFDLDGVLRDLSSALARRFNVSTPITAEEARILYEKLDVLDSKATEKIWANASLYHGAKSLLTSLYENKKDTDILMLLTASGFSYGSHYGTMRFLEQAKLPFDIEMIMMSTEDKIERILELSEDCDEMVVIDDYDKVLKGAPDWTQCILIDNLQDDSRGKYPGNWKVVRRVSDLKLADIL